MIISAPISITRPISERAAYLARQMAPKSKLQKAHGADHLQPLYHPGEIGIEVPDEYHYMLIQNRGFKAFNMMSLEGKTIPIRGANGQINFRVAKNVGKRKITTRDEYGQIVSSKIAWRHPGLAPKHFLQRACLQAIKEYQRQMKAQSVVTALKDTEAGPYIEALQKVEKQK